MAKIKNTDVAEKDVFRDLKNSAESTLLVLEAMTIKLKDNLEAQKALSKGFKATNVKDIQALAKAQDEVKKSVQGLTEVEKEKIKLETTLKKLNSDKIQQNEELKVLISDQRRVNKELAKDTVNLGNAYQKLTRETNKAQAEFKRLATQFGVNSKEAKNAKKSFDELDSKLRKVNDAAKDGRRDVGRYGIALQGIGSQLRIGFGALGITAGVAGLVGVVGNAINVFKGFEQANSKLKSVLGATADEMKLLSDQAKELGASSAYSSTQVTELQTEFAKLGFPTKDILNMTSSTLDAAAAMGSQLGEQAALTGATLKAFGLSSKEAGRVNDVLAKSTTRSALDFSKLNESMSTIAPVAKAYGFQLEDTVALLGNLADSGFDASTAATATRNIFLNLADSSGKLAKRLKEPVKDLPSLIRGLKQLKSENIDLAGALELTDVRSVAAFSTFLEGTDSLQRLSTELNNAEGAAAAMAATMLDNLAGDIEQASGAWEGFILSLEDGKGVFSAALRELTQATTDFLSGLTLLNKTFAELEVDKINKKFKQFSENGQQAAKDVLADFEKAGLSGDRLANALKNASDRALENYKLARGRKDLNMSASYLEEYKALQEIINPTKEVNDEINKNTKLTKEQLEAIKKRNEELDKYRKMLEDVQNSLIKDDLTRELATTQTEFRRKISDIKGNSETEKELRKSLKEKEQQELQAIIKKYEDKQKKPKADITKLDLLSVEDTENAFDIGGKEYEKQLELEKQKRIENREKTLALIEALERQYFERRKAAADKELSDAEKREEDLKRLAERGIQDAQDSLAQNQKDQAEAQRKKEEILQQEKRAEIALALIKAYNAELDKGADSSTAMGKALVSQAVLVAAAQSLPAFYDGVEDTGNGGNLDGKGGFMAVLHPNERVIPKSINDKLDGITNKDLGKLADNGLLSYALNSQNMGIQFSKQSPIEMELKKLYQSNQEIVKAIENKPVDMGWEVDDIKKVVTHRIKEANKTTKINYKL